MAGKIRKSVMTYGDKAMRRAINNIFSGAMRGICRRVQSKTFTLVVFKELQENDVYAVNYWRV